MPILKKLDHNFFGTWSRPMAYVLGFFAADGSMLKNNRGAHFIEFHITDKELLFKIRKMFASNHKISVRLPKQPTHKMSYRLQIGSKQMFADLTSLGFCQHKSLTMNFPAVPQEYLADFVRGYFDGDGCVYCGLINASDRKQKRHVMNALFTSGSRSFLTALHKLLRMVVKGGSMRIKERGFELAFSHRDSLALFQFMYNNVPDSMRLRRKFHKYQSAIRTLKLLQS